MAPITASFRVQKPADTHAPDVHRGDGGTRAVSDGDAGNSRWIQAGVAAVLAAALTAGCGETTTTAPDDDGSDLSASVVVEPQSADVKVSDTLQLDARVVDQKGNNLSGYEVHWGTSDPDVASVSDNGVVTGEVQGTVEVLVEASTTDGTQVLSSNARISVVPRSIAKISISPPSLTVTTGDSVQLEATVTDEGGSELNRPVDWSSLDPSVADIDGEGVVVGMSEGQVSIVARASNVADTADATVMLEPVASVEVTPDSVTLSEGETIQLVATVRDSAGKEIDRSVSWSSSDTSVATVDALGEVQAHVEGEATITAWSGEASGTAQVVVEATSSPPSMPSSVSVSEDSRTDTTVLYTAQWESSDGADSYSWEAGSDNGTWSDSGAGVTSTEVSFTAPRSASDDDSFFCVRAVNSEGESEPGCNSYTVPATTSGTFAAPSELSVSATSSTSVSGSFTDNTDSEDAFELARNDGSGWVLALELTAGETDFSDTGLSTQTTYQYRVRAVSSSDTSEFSNIDETTTPSDDDTGAGTFRANEPTGFVTAGDQDWTDLTDGVGRSWNTTDWNGDVRLVSGLSASPESPPDGLEQFYPEGMGDGEQAGLAWTGVRDVSPTEIYMATTFRSSPDWVRCANGHKLIIFQIGDASNNGTSQVRVGWNGANDTEHHTGKEMHLAIGNGFEAHPKTGSTLPLDNNEVVIGDEADVEVGEWAQVEAQVQIGQPGRLRLWVNGVLVSDHDITFDDQDSHVIEFQHAGTYGGGCTTSPLDHDQSLFYGHTYLSTP